MTLADHLPILPVLLPALTAVLLLVIGDAPARLHWARAVALASVLLGAVFAFRLVEQAGSGALTVYRLGDWPAPFGIVLVIDRLSALMLALSAAVALPVLWQACAGWDARGRHFHALFQFQLMGLNGAFVTGDLFNLFVFFEVLLIASYVLMVHGLGRERLRAGLHYVALNLLASALFLVGIALVYATTGTLNLADLALRVPRVPAPEAGLLQAGALLLLVVFGFKAALMPLSMWLPATYAAASAPVAALFAIMTKVGVYAILRVHGVVFGAEAGASALLVQPLLLPLALATGVVGVIGAMAAATLPRQVAWLTVASVGSILIALGLFDAAAWSAGLYYLLHSTLVVAALFLLAGLVAAQRGEAGDALLPGPRVAQPALLGGLFVLAAASATGLPPLPGFVGKLMLLQAAAHHGWAVAVWAVVLGAGLLTLVGLARAGSVVFWAARSDVPAGGAAVAWTAWAPTVLLLGAGVALSVFAAPVQRYTAAAVTQLHDRATYARAVLPELGGERADSARPFRVPPLAPSPSVIAPATQPARPVSP